MLVLVVQLLLLEEMLLSLKLPLSHFPPPVSRAVDLLSTEFLGLLSSLKIKKIKLNIFFLNLRKVKIFYYEYIKYFSCKKKKLSHKISMYETFLLHLLNPFTNVCNVQNKYFKPIDIFIKPFNLIHTIII